MAPGRPSRPHRVPRRDSRASRPCASRRKILAGLGTVAVAATAGCLGSLSGAAGPRYRDYERAELIPGADAFPEGWAERPELNENYVVFGGPEDRAFVGLDAEVFPDVDAATAAFSETRSGMRRPEDHALADEAFWDEVDGEYALTVFRHSNALGQTFALKETKQEVLPDRTRSHRYAEAMYRHWQGL